jgi:hypothetical protein
LRGIISLFGIPADDIKKPDNALPASYPDVTITKTELVLSLKKSTKEFTVESVAVDVELFGSISILTAPPVSLEGIQVHLDYKKGDQTAHGYVAMGLRVSSALVWMKYDRDADGKEIYSGQLTLDATNQLDYTQMVAAFSPPSEAVQKPDSAPASIAITQLSAKISPGSSLEIWGNAETDWTFNVFDGMPVTLTRLGGGILVTSTPPPAGSAAAATIAYDAYLSGIVAIPGFKSTVEGRLQIGSSRPSVLSALLLRNATTTTGSDIDLVIGQVPGQPKWQEATPTGTTSVNFSQMVYLYANLTDSSFAIYGEASDVMGKALLICYMDTNEARRNYIFSLELDVSRGLAALWQPLGDTFDHFLSLKSASVQFLSNSTSYKRIKEENSLVFDAAKSQGVTWPETALSTQIEGTIADTEIAPAGAWILATIDLAKPTPLSRMLSAFQGEQPTGSEITLAAFIPKGGDHTSPTYRVILKDFQALGGIITVNAQGSYTPPVGTSTSSTIDVTGDVKLRLGDDEIDFLVTISVLEAKTSWTVTQAATIAQPFGHMFGITFQDAKLGGSVEIVNNVRVSNVFVSGTVTLGTLSLVGTIMFVKEVPQVVVISVDVGLSIDQVFSLLLTGSTKATSWPFGDSIFRLETATLYYARTQTDNQPLVIAGKSYEAGYHIDANVQFFGQPFTVSVELPVDKDGDGILIQGMYRGVIDFVFLKLTGYTDPDTNVQLAGMTVFVDTTANKRIYGMKCGLELLGTSGFNLKFDYTPVSKVYTGEASYNGEILGITNPVIGILYDGAKITITSMPMFKDLDELLDLAQAIRAAGQGGECGELVGLVFDKAIKSKFHVNFKQTGFENMKLTGTITGTYSIDVAGLTTVDVAMPDLELELDLSGGFSLDRILPILAEFLLTNAPKIAKQLLLNPEKTLSVILAKMVVEKFAKELISSLLCRGVKPQNVIDRANEIVEEQATESGEQANNGEQGGADAAAATTLDAAIAATDVAVAAVGVLAGLLGAIQAIWKWFTGESEQEKEAKRNLARGQAAAAAALDIVQTSLNMSKPPTLSFLKIDELTIDWSDALPNRPNFDYGGFESILWQVRIGTTDNFDDARDEIPTSARRLDLTRDQFRQNATIYVWVRAAQKSPMQLSPLNPSVSDKYHSKEWSHASLFHEIQMPAVTSVSMQLFPDDSVNVTFPTQTAGTYNIRLVDPVTGNEIVAQQLAVSDDQVGPDATQQALLNIDLIEIPTTIKDIKAQVNLADPQGIKATSIWVDSSSQISIGDAPQGLIANTDPPSDIHMSWTRDPATATSNNYEISVLDQSNNISRMYESFGGEADTKITWELMSGFVARNEVDRTQWTLRARKAFTEGVFNRWATTPCPPPITCTTVGLPWIGGLADLGTWAGTFTVQINHAAILVPEDLRIEVDSERDDTTFVVTVDNTRQFPLFSVSFTITAVRDHRLRLSFRNQTLNPPDANPDAWTLTALEIEPQLKNAHLIHLDTTTGIPNSTMQFNSDDQRGLQFSTFPSSGDDSLVTGSYIWSLGAPADGQGVAFYYHFQWALTQDPAKQLTVTAPFPVGGGKKVRWIAPPDTNGHPGWYLSDDVNGDVLQHQSSIVASLLDWHDIVYHYSPTEIRVYEDGQLVVNVPQVDALKSTDPSRIIHFGIEVTAHSHAVGGLPSAVFFKDIKALSGIIPSGGHGTTTVDGKELVFNEASRAANRQWFILPTDSVISVDYTPSSLRFHTDSLTA